MCGQRRWKVHWWIQSLHHHQKLNHDLELPYTLGVAPFPGCQGNHQIYYIFSKGIPINLHFSLFLGGGSQERRGVSFWGRGAGTAEFLLASMYFRNFMQLRRKRKFREVTVESWESKGTPPNAIHLPPQKIRPFFGDFYPGTKMGFRKNPLRRPAISCGGKRGHVRKVRPHGFPLKEAGNAPVSPLEIEGSTYMTGSAKKTMLWLLISHETKDLYKPISITFWPFGMNHLHFTVKINKIHRR